MESLLSDQSSKASHAVVNYSSSSYGGLLFRSPNSPPPSPSPFPSSSAASVSQLFLNARPGFHGPRAAAYNSSPAGCFQLRQPPLLPFPRSDTLQTPSKRVPAAIPASSIRSRRQNPKRKGKMFAAGAMKETSLPTTKVKDEVKPVVAAIEVKVVEKDELQPCPMRAKPVEKVGRRSTVEKVTEEEDEMESAYSLSPSPSNLPFPRFSLIRSKANAGGIRGSVAGSCIAEVAEAAGDTNDLQQILHI